MSILSRLAIRYIEKTAALFNDQGSNPKVAKALKQVERKVKAKQIPNVKRLIPFTVIENSEGLETGLVEWNKDVLEIDTSSRGLSQGGPGGKLSYELYLLIAVGDRYWSEVVKAPKRREWIQLAKNKMGLFRETTRVPPTQIQSPLNRSFAYSFAQYVLDTLPTELENPFEHFLGLASKRDEIETGSLGIELDPNRHDKIDSIWRADTKTAEEAKEEIVNKLNDIFPLAKYKLGRPLKAEDIYDMVGASAIPSEMNLSINMLDDYIDVSGVGNNIESFQRTIGFNGVITNQELIFSSQKYNEDGKPVDDDGDVLTLMYEQEIPSDIEPSDMVQVLHNNEIFWDFEEQLSDEGFDFTEEDLEEYLDRIDIDTDTSAKTTAIKNKMFFFLEDQLPLNDPDFLDTGDSYYVDEVGNLWNGDGTLTKGMPKGTGSKLFAAQVQAAQKIGMKRIECTAAKSDVYVGYKVWYKLGYDGLVGDDSEEYLPEEYTFPVNERVINNMSRSQLLDVFKEHFDNEDEIVEMIEDHLDYEPDVYDAEEEAKALYASGEWETELDKDFFVSKITEMAESGDYKLEKWGIGPRWSLQTLLAEGLEDWWEDNGFGWNASFDLSDDSRNFKILKNYIERKSGGEVNNWFHKVSQTVGDGVTLAGGAFDSEELGIMDEIYREFIASNPFPSSEETIKLVRDSS